MNKLWIIIKREYLSKVQKKSFFVLTILGPILMTLLIVLPVILKNNTRQRFDVIVVDNVKKSVIGSDTVSFFEGKFKSNDILDISYSKDIAQAQGILADNQCDAVVELVNTNDTPPLKTFIYYADKELSSEAKSNIKEQTKEIFKNTVLQVNYNMTKQDIAAVNDPQIGFYTKDIRTGKDSYSEIKIALGAILGFMIYFFIFFFGGQIMRSVSEEKTSKIVEVLISSVKSVYLLFGKIIAVALVGMTQLALWVVLTAVLLTGVKIAKPDVFAQKQTQTVQINERVVSVDTINALDDTPSALNQTIQGLRAINIPLILIMFVIYFLLGYLLYGTLFGAVGSLVDEDADAGQFSLPITIPLIFAIVCIPMLMDNPSSDLAVWLSIIPFTSPMIMLLRIPFGVAIWQVILSIVLLVICVILSTVIAAKIYRSGILTYGKQLKWGDLWKFLKTKEKDK